MYKVGDKFDIKYIDDFFCEIIGLIPGGQSQKETVYILSFAGTKFNFSKIKSTRKILKTLIGPALS